MSKTLLTLGILFVASVFHAQIMPANLMDIPVTTTSNPNTGIAISPHPGMDHDYTVVVTENGLGSNSHDVYIYNNQSTGTAPLVPGPFIGMDPDVAYFSNPDLFYVVANDGMSDVLLTEFYYTGSSYIANPAISLFSNGTNVNSPNIDMNSEGEGVVVFEDNGDIFAVAVPGPFSTTAAAPVPIGSGMSPDVAVHDFIDAYTVTFIDPTGNLVINSYSFDELSITGSVNSVQTWGPFPPPINITNFEIPRIATCHHKQIGNFEDFTVTVEGSPGQILAYSHSPTTSSTMYQNVVVNKSPNTVSCGSVNAFPVVTYSFDSTVPNKSKIVIAWSSEYSFCGFTSPAGTNNGVLLAELNLALNPINSGSFFREVNQIPGNFSMSRSSITSEYDGDYEIDNQNESITYFDQTFQDLYWKNRDLAPTDQYKGMVNVADDVESKNYNFRNNNLTNTFEITTSSNRSKNIALYNMMGQQLLIKKLRPDENSFTYDYSNLPIGSYIVSFESGTQIESFTMVNY